MINPITSIQEYSLSTSSWSPISLKKEKTYSYRKNGWKDQMNKFNGYNISVSYTHLTPQVECLLRLRRHRRALPPNT